MLLAFPSVNEQQTIAQFLDHKTQQIDQLIAKKQTLIDKLNEQRIALITHAVTKGLNRAVTLKDSGVEWLEEVPEHWDIRRLKFAINIQNGRDYKNVEASEGYPVLGSGGVFRFATDYLYDGESVLFGRKGTIDKPLYINEKFWTVDTMFYSVILKGTDGKFLYFVAKVMQFDWLATQTALPSITQSDLGNYLIAFPPYEEQREIVEYLDKETARIDRMVELNQQTIDKLKEYRTALITAAVTGKIDVRKWRQTETKGV
ncbi:MAG: type I restriction endonuclease subunit S [Thiothrix sp.]|nr:MAG: type I restriction endonuclease subunit S [Thiothrix sp.]